jgi:thiol-disulfide isomerase/thioredoxin
MRTHLLSAAFVALILAGAGCPAGTPPLDIPSAPPESPSPAPNAPEPPQGGSDTAPAANPCDLEGETGMCKAYFPSWQFDKASGTCTEFVWGGCEGVRPFTTKEECEASCVGRREATGDAGGGLQREPAPTAPSVKALPPYYVAYSADGAAKANAERRPVVLYFWASWCPICRADEPLIKQRIEASGMPIAGFRVNFDTEKELKTKYGVPYQHTTIILFPDGTESERFTGPVDEATFFTALAAAAK